MFNFSFDETNIEKISCNEKICDAEFDDLKNVIKSSCNDIIEEERDAIENWILNIISS